MARKKAKVMKRAERQRRVAANLLAGMTYREIAEAMGISLGTISNDANTILATWKAERQTDAGEWIAIQVKRMERVIHAIWTPVTAGDLQAIDRLLRVIEQEGRTLGFEHPAPHVHMTEAELDTVIDGELARLAAGRQAGAIDPLAEDQPAEDSGTDGGTEALQE